MSEMLANQFFLVRNFIPAKSIYERILDTDPENKSISKKLIICYVTTGEIGKALDLFFHLIKMDVDFIINTKTDSEDCPCPEIISKIENHEKLFDNEIEKSIALGILWLYCSLEKSIEYFKKIEVINSNDNRIKEINSILINKLISNKQNSIN